MDLSKNIERVNLPERFKKKLLLDLEVIASSQIKDLLYIILFGSCAKNNYTAESDLDIMVVTENKVDFHEAAEISFQLETAVDGVATDIIFYTKNELKYGKSLFSREVREYGKVVWSKYRI